MKLKLHRAMRRRSLRFSTAAAGLLVGAPPTFVAALDTGADAALAAVRSILRTIAPDTFHVEDETPEVDEPPSLGYFDAPPAAPLLPDDDLPFESTFLEQQARESFLDPEDEEVHDPYGVSLAHELLEEQSQAAHEHNGEHDRAGGNEHDGEIPSVTAFLEMQNLRRRSLTPEHFDDPDAQRELDESEFADEPDEDKAEHVRGLNPADIPQPSKLIRRSAAQRKKMRSQGDDDEEVVGGDKFGPAATSSSTLSRGDHSVTTNPSPSRRTLVSKRSKAHGFLPTSFIDMSALAPNPYARVHLFYCRGDRDCSDSTSATRTTAGGDLTADETLVKVCPSVSSDASGKEYYTLVANPLAEGRCKNPDWDMLQGNADPYMITKKNQGKEALSMYTTCSVAQRLYFQSAALALNKPPGEAMLAEMCLWNAWRGRTVQDVLLLTGKSCDAYFADMCMGTLSVITGMLPDSATESDKHCRCEVAREIDDWLHATGNVTTAGGGLACGAMRGQILNGLKFLECGEDSYVWQDDGVANHTGNASVTSAFEREGVLRQRGSLLDAEPKQERFVQEPYPGANLHVVEAGGVVSLAAAGASASSASKATSTRSADDYTDFEYSTSKISSPPPAEFEGFHMYNAQVIRNCGIKVALFSRSYPLPDGLSHADAGNLANIGNSFAYYGAAASSAASSSMETSSKKGGTAAAPSTSALMDRNSNRNSVVSASALASAHNLENLSLADAGTIPIGDSHEAEIQKGEVYDLFAKKDELYGNVVPNSVNYDIGDARGAATKVFPSDEDESFYFVLEPQLPDHKLVFRVRYQCSNAKKTVLEELHEKHADYPGSYPEEEKQYVSRMLGLCENNYYWCVKEDAITGISKFYLCNNGGLTATFRLMFSHTSLRSIYAAKERETDVNPGALCTSLYNEEYLEALAGGNSLRLGYEQTSYIPATFSFVTEAVLVATFFICLVGGALYVWTRRDDERMKAIEERRKFWVSQHTTVTATGHDGGKSADRKKPASETRPLLKSDPHYDQGEHVLEGKDDLKKKDYHGLAHQLRKTGTDLHSGLS
eukprot:CAMPEP_0178997202 /NCGR_PEP_ID=MMETSP0795-20121207/8795_1 /TAXON_ID=88552 /ORGANISM="Amoebophrya sp., Strain Ameob2" /LENGTH=1056 /DNA_ID=CAMNT_0020689681 /DNA_START=97 /DNA_END=3267 /DNA_ORIENTATION=+